MREWDKKLLHAGLDYIKRIPVKPSLTELILRRESTMGPIASKELHGKNLYDV